MVSESASPLARRVAPQRPVRGASESLLEKSLGVELPRSADELLSLVVAVSSVSHTLVEFASIVANLDDTDLMCAISDGAKAFGLVVADAEFLASVIEVQTLGQVKSQKIAPRTPTKTDAAVAGDLLDAWLREIAKIPEAGLVTPNIGPMTRQAELLDSRGVELTLNPGKYRLLKLTLAFGQRARTGTLSVFVPNRSNVGFSDYETLGQQLRPHVYEAHAEFDAVLAHIQKNISDVMDMKVGDVISISADRLNSVQLEANGQVISLAKLGQWNGNRAVRLIRPDNSFTNSSGKDKGKKDGGSERVNTNAVPDLVPDRELAAELPRSNDGPPRVSGDQSLGETHN